MKKIIFIIPIIFILALFPMASCSSANPQSDEPTVVEQPTESEPTTDVQPESSVASEIKYDMAGNPLELPQSIDKIVSTAPALTHILIELGLGDKIIGIDEYSSGIEGISEGLPEFNILSPDVERLISLEPDIIFATTMSIVNDENPFKQVSDAGVCIAYFPTASSISEIKSDIEFLGAATGTLDEAKIIIENMRTAIGEIRDVTEGIEQKKRVMFEISSAPYIYSFGKNVFLNEMIEIIGAENIFADQDGWLPVSEETAIAANPDVILTNVNYGGDPVEEILSRNGWEVVSAVQNNQVFYIDNDASSQPCQNITTALKQMAEAVYPEYFN